MIVKTTIEFESSDLLTQDKLSKIQAILEDKEPPVDPPVEGPGKCEEGPEPKSVKVLDEETLEVLFHAVKVTPLDWEVSDLIGNLNGQGRLKPGSNTIGIKLTSPLKSAPKYRLTLKGVECTGVFSLDFDNPYYVPPVVGNPCDKAPEPLEFNKKGDFTADLVWHGDGVEELEVIVETRSGKKAGGKKVRPQASDRGHLDIPMTNIFENEDEFLVTMKGISCDGGKTKGFPNPFKKKDDGDDDCCKTDLNIVSIQMTNE